MSAAVQSGTARPDRCLAQSGRSTQKAGSHRQNLTTGSFFLSFCVWTGLIVGPPELLTVGAVRGIVCLHATASTAVSRRLTQPKIIVPALCDQPSEQDAD